MGAKRGGRLLAFFAFFFTAPSFGTATFFLDLGAYSDNLQQRFSAPAGFASQVSTLTGFVRARPAFVLSSSFTFEPSIAVLAPWRSGADGFAKTFTSFVAFDLGVHLASWLVWRVGTSGMVNWAITGASAEQLNNGTGTSTFYLPGGSSLGLQFLVETGIVLRFTHSVSLGMDLWVSSVASSTRRRYQAAAYLGIAL